MLDHELQGFDDSATYIEFAMKRKDDPVYSAALERLQTFKADTDEKMQDELKGILPFYFANPTKFGAKMLETMQNMPSPWALNHQRAADRKRPTYLVDDLDNVTAKTLMVVGRDDPFCSVKAAEKAHAGMAKSELVVFENCGHFAWIENEECLDVVSRFLREYKICPLLIEKTRNIWVYIVSTLEICELANFCSSVDSTQSVLLKL